MIVKNQTEAGEFEKEIEKLRAHGGGDCPEYTFEGMRGALNDLEMNGSPLYVFTDAGPKDATEAGIEEVRTIAKERGVAINFLTTGIIRAEFLINHLLTFLWLTSQAGKRKRILSSDWLFECKARYFPRWARRKNIINPSLAKLGE